MNRKSEGPAAQMRAKASVRKTKPKASSAAKLARAKPVRPKSPQAPKSSREKVQAYRKRMRDKGLRLVQMWLPDARTPEFAAEARRQSLLANHSPFAAEDQAWADSMSDWKLD